MVKRITSHGSAAGASAQGAHERDQNAVLSVESVHKTYNRGEREFRALEDVSFSINEGEFVSIVGASGCGKTTLLRIIDGLDTPSSGTILLDGSPIDPGVDVAFVFQQDSLFPWRTVLDNILFGPEIKHRRKEARQTALEYADIVGLSEFVNHYPHELSGGMRQRVNIARALTCNPRVLLMDEPLASLDAQTREIMQGELLRVWEQTGKSILFVTHQIDEAVYLSNRVLIFSTRPGRLKEQVTIDLPTPRDMHVKRTREFSEHVEQIWDSIETEVRGSLRAEMHPE